VIAIGLVPVLTKNPAYTQEARSIAVVLGSFTGSTLSGAEVESFLAKTSVDPVDARAIAGLVNAAWDTYQRRYAEQVGKAIRPDVKMFLAAVANGIERAVAAIPKG